MKNRCFWCNLNNPLYVRYHDDEWGVPCHDDRQLYELLMLECFQAGLSWECILNKREAFRIAYEGFDIERVIAFDERKIERLMSNPGIIRNRRKIEASISNSIVFRAVQLEMGSFDAYIWNFTGNRTIVESCTSRTSSPLSNAVSCDLRRRGMRFVGTVTIYAYLQSIGVVNAHTEECFRHPSHAR